MGGTKDSERNMSPERQEQLQLPGGFGGPYVAAAVFCEKVLQEADGMLSLIRIVDRITFHVVGPQGAPVPVPLFLVLMLKAGHTQGTHEVSVRAMGPSGQDLGTIQTPMLFESNDRGVNVIIPFPFRPTEDGLYWFHVAVEGQPLTRVPLRAIFQRTLVTTGGAGPPAGE
jgi:hypothetical protein